MLERAIDSALIVLAYLHGIGCVIAVGVMIAYWRYHRETQAHPHLRWPS